MKRIKTNLIISTIVTFIVLIMIMGSFYYFFIKTPAEKYQNAQDCIASGDVAKAAELLYEFDYKNSAELMQQLCAENPSFALYTLKVGDTVSLGKYKDEALTWNVIDNQDGVFLLQTEKVIDKKIYNEDANEHNSHQFTWSETSLCRWLNSDFSEEAFSKTEQSMICKIGPEETGIFILSEDEAENYGKEQCGTAQPTAYAFSAGCGVETDGNTGVMYRGNTVTYFIRDGSYGRKNYWDTENGKTYEAYGVRPCMWIKPAEMKTEAAS